MTKPANISSSTATKIDKERLKQFKYIENPYDGPKLKNRVFYFLIQEEIFDEIKKRGENTFRAGGPVKDYFGSNNQLFGGELKSKVSKKK